MKGFWHKRSKLQRRLLMSSSALVALILLVTLLPTYTARYFLDRTLNQFGIETEGIKTVRVNVWKREIWVGPVRFHTGKSDDGQLGQLGIKVNIIPIFQKHALVEKLIVRGIDITLIRSGDNKLTLNGIPLSQFQSSKENKTEQEVTVSHPWGMGVVNFEMQNCRLEFLDKLHGRLVVKINSLLLKNFANWKPDAPGSIDLKARINDIVFNVTGTARPFAKQITLNLDTETRDIQLAKIIAFTGPLGLDRVGGIYESTMHHEITIFRTGRVEGRVAGQIGITDADYAAPGNAAFTFKQANFKIDDRYNFSETSSLKISGELGIDIVDAAAKQANGNSYAFKSAKVQLDKLVISRDSNNQIKVGVEPKINIQQGEFSGNVNLSMDAGLQALKFLQSISAPPSDKSQKTGLEKWAGDEVSLPRADVTVSELNTQMELLKFRSSEGKFSLDLKSASQVTGVSVTTERNTTHIDSVRGKLASLKMNSGQNKTALKLTGGLSATEFVVDGKLGKGTVGSYEISQDINLQINKGDISLNGKAATNLKDVEALLFNTDTLPQANLTLGSLDTQLSHLAYSMEKKKLKWAVNADARIDKATIAYAKGEIASSKVDKLSISGVSVDQNLNVVAKSVLIEGLDSTTTRLFVDGILAKQPEAERKPEEKNISKQDKRTKAVSLQLRLDKFSLINGAKINFLDNKVHPPFHVNLDIKQADLGDIDTRRPEQQAYADVSATLNQYTNLELHGKATSPGPKIDMALTGELKNLELATYSSYAAEFLGMNFSQGQLNTDVNLKANAGNLNGNIQLDIRHLEFEMLSDEQTNHLSETAGMPIGLAVKLLQDRNGDIDLSLPITGTIDDPDVGIRDAIQTAASKTLYVIYPPALVLSLLDSGFKSVSAAKFEPIKFQPGSVKLDAKAREYLDKLKDTLKERSRMSISVCGRTNADDFKAVTGYSIKLESNPAPATLKKQQQLIEKYEQSLLDLAQQRTQVVREYLLKNTDITPAQVGACRAEFKPDNTSSPSVMVTL